MNKNIDMQSIKLPKFYSFVYILSAGCLSVLLFEQAARFCGDEHVHPLPGKNCRCKIMSIN